MGYLVCFASFHFRIILLFLLYLKEKREEINQKSGWIYAVWRAWREGGGGFCGKTAKHGLAWVKKKRPAEAGLF